MSVSADQLGKAILAAGLMAPDELKTWWSALPANQRPKDGQALARLLVEAGKLTQFQAGELLAPSGVPLILGDYVLLRRIGAGGMGQVFQARHKTMDRLVAIKLLPTALTKDAAAIERFRREVKAAAKLLHPNIVAAFDAGEWKQQHYLVMEYVEGRDLAAVASDEGPLAIDRAVNYLRQAAHGLAFAHGKGVIHRDIKPANLLVDRDGVVKILDMGLARIEEPAQVAAQAGLTQSGQVMGTVDYMAPEQALNVKGVDGRADIYSLGCTLFRLLTGRNVYEGDTLVARLMSHQSSPIPELARYRPDVPRPLVEIFQRMVAKLPEDRFHSMAEVEAALADLNTEAPAAAQTDAPSGAGSGVRDFLKSLTGKFGVTVSEKEPAVGMAGQPLKAHSPTMSVSHPHALTDPLPERSVQLARQSVAEAGARRRSIALAAGIAAAALAIVLFGGWWMLPAPKSVLKLEITDSETAVAIDDGEAEYRGATKQSIPLVPGNHVLHFFRGEQEWDKLELSLAKGQEISVTIERSGGYLRVKRNDELVLARDLNQFKLVASDAKPVGGETCLEFSGKTGKDEVDLNFPLDATKPFTLEGYFRQTGAPPANAPGFASTLYVWNYVAIASGTGWGLRLSGQKTPTAFEHVLGNKTTERDRWTHVAGVFDGKQASFYMDGKLVQAKDVSANPPAKSPQTLRMGWKFVGHAKEVRISSTARYDKDFTPAARFTPDNSTLALYHCDEGTGDVLKDSSGSNRHGKIVGAKWVKADVTPITSPEFNNALGMEFVRVPAGKSWLGGGGGKPGTREIEFKQEFELGKFEVTQAQWQTVMGSVPGEYTRTGKEKDRLKELSDAQIARLPVNAVSWNDCQEFLKKLNAQSAERGWKYRLPTADEWEYACRGGPVAKAELHAFNYYFQGPTNALDKDSANFDKTLSRPASVGSYPPNRLGIHDMHGNMAEWCADPSEQEASLRYLKGGGFQDNAELCTAAARSIGAASDAYAAAGLRLVREPIAPKSAAWQSLFNGKDLTGWKKSNPNDTGQAEVMAVDGQPTLKLSQKSGLRTEATPKDFHLRFEFKAEPECRGGVSFFHGNAISAQIRVDSLARSNPPRLIYHALSVSSQSAQLAGGRFEPIGKPLHNAKGETNVEFKAVTLDPGSSWQRVEIIRLGDSVVFLVNHQVAGAVTGMKDLRKQAPVPFGYSPIILWSDGEGTAQFRNIEIREITALPPEILKTETAWQSLFNGKDTAGWTAVNATEKGTMTVETVDGGAALRLTGATSWKMAAMGDYHLRFDYQPTTRAGTGGVHLLHGNNQDFGCRIGKPARDSETPVKVNGVGCSYRAATIRDGQIVGIGNLLGKEKSAVVSDRDSVTLAEFPLRAGDAWQHWEIVRLGDSFAFLINGRFVGAVTGVRDLRDPANKPFGKLPIVFFNDVEQPSYLRNIEIREITALPPELLAAAASQASALMGTWQIKGRDAAKVDWTGTLVLKEGDKEAGGLTGYIDWSGSDGTKGREHLAVAYNDQTRLLRLTGQRHENSNGLILGKYTAELSPDGQRLNKGTWTEGGSDGTWQADRVTNLK